MTVSVSLHGFKGLAADLRRLKFSVPKAARPVIARSAKRLERSIRSAAPVDKGELRRSIKSSVSRDGLSATVRASAHHALPVEGGTRHRPATPFFYSTAKKNAAAIHAAIDKAVAEGVK